MEVEGIMIVAEGITTVDSGSELQIQSEQLEDITIFKLSGDLNSFNVELAYNALVKVINNKRYNVILDLSNLNYIDSSGIGFMTEALKRLYEKGGDMKIVYMTPYVSRIIKLLHLDYFLDVYDELNEAIKDFKANIAKAIFKWQKIVELKPNYADAYYHLALAYKNSGMISEAIDEINKSLRINGNYVKALNLYGKLMLIEKKMDRAIETFKKVLELDPQDMEGMLNLACCYDDNNMLDEAIKRFVAAISLYPDYPDLYFHLANALLKKNDVNGAIENFKKAIELNNNYIDVHRALSRIYINVNKNEEAIAELKEIIDLSLDEEEISNCKKEINMLRSIEINLEENKKTANKLSQKC